MPRFTAPHRTTTFLDQLELTGRVICAIILREFKTRFGRSKLGFIWALIEPMAYVGVFVVIRDVSSNHVPFGQDIALFIVSGMLTFRMFSAITTRSLSAISANKALLAYPPVKPLDCIVARATLEALTMLIVWAIFLLILSTTADNKIVFHHDAFFEAIISTIFLAFGISVFNASLSAISPTWERVWSIARLPLMILSGIFFVPVLMPPWIQSLIYWNPVMHCVEWIRTGIYLTYDPFLSKTYVISFALISLSAGLVLERGYRYKLTS